MSSDFTDFSKLRRIIEDIGVTWQEKTEGRKKTLWEGELITGENEVIVTGEGLFEILPDGSVVRVMVHVPQGPYSRAQSQGYLDDPANGWHKYHIFWCQTVADWHKNLRKTNRDDGKFSYPVFLNNGSEYRSQLRDGGRPLHLCKNCYKHLHRKNNYGQPEAFDVSEFLKTEGVGSNFSSVSFTSDYDLIPNVYPKEWAQISNNLKVMRNWTCEKCHLNLEDHKKFLHAHHRNERKDNNSIFNLQALCIRCHSKAHPRNTLLSGSDDLNNFITIFPGGCPTDR